MKSAGLPRFGSDGSFLGYVGCSFDIHDVKQYQEALSEADQRKNEFLAMLAHELRNPLAPIRNALEILRLTGGNEGTIRPACEIIERQLSQMIRLVDDLLDVSRVTRGKIELRIRRIELASVVTDAVEAARPRLDSKGVDLDVGLPSQAVYLAADPVRLAQVITNLLNNAGKFTAPGGRIWLTSEVVEAKDTGLRKGNDEKKDSSGEALAARHSSLSPSHACIRVRDTGIGIAIDHLPHIFDMFYQVDTSLERKQSGLGIGLMLAKNLVELHGGILEAHSAGLGQGSEFVVRLPLAMDESAGQSAQETEAVRDAANAHPAPCANKRRILVVDDNLDSAESLTTLLDLTGNETRAAYDGVEAMEVASAFQPQVILLDIGLPELNGYEVAHKIRQQPWGRNVLLIALTGWGQEDDRRRSKEAGFDHHLVKPVEPAVLKRLLAEQKS
jgi:signal transduction histidine kinase